LLAVACAKPLSVLEKIYASMKAHFNDKTIIAKTSCRLVGGLVIFENGPKHKPTNLWLWRFFYKKTANEADARHWRGQRFV